MAKRAAPEPRKKKAGAARRSSEGAWAREVVGADGRTETQLRLLDAALGLFAERGYDGVTTAEIAARAGVAEKTLFANFGSKELLYQSTLEPAAVLLPEAIRTLTPVFAAPPDDPRALLRAVLENRIRFAREHRREVKLLAQHLLLRPDGLRLLTDAWSERVGPLVMPIVDRLIAQKKIRADVPPMVVMRILATSAVGYVLTSVVLQPELEWDDAREIAHIVDVLADGLAPREGARGKKPRGD